MATIYTLRASASDLTGGADFSVDLIAGAVGASSLSPSIAAGGVDEISFAFTEAGNPGVDGGSGSRSFTVEVRVTTGVNNTTLRIQLHRINSSGTVQSSGTISSTQAVDTSATTLTYNFTDDLGTFAAGDRLRVDYVFNNSHSHSARTPTIETGTTDTEHTTPWTIVVDTSAEDSAARAYVPPLTRTLDSRAALAAGMTPSCTEEGEVLI